MNLDLFKNVINKMSLYIIYSIYIKNIGIK